MPNTKLTTQLVRSLPSKLKHSLRTLMAALLLFAIANQAIAQTEPQPYFAAQSAPPYLDEYAQNRAGKSKRAVINEVKRRYPAAKILRVKLNKSGSAYNVRILLPNGKVKTVRISAS